MKQKTVHCFLLIFLYTPFKSIAQEEVTIASAVTSRLYVGYIQPDDGIYARVFLYYPLEKSGNPYSIFLNKKSIGKITNGGRIECKLLFEGSLAITLIEGYNYKEPLTQSKNSRTISISKGKSYYFRVTGSGALEYILSTGKGQSNFGGIKRIHLATCFIY